MKRERISGHELNTELFLSIGLTGAQISQLIEFATNDGAVREQTSDPVRFRDRNAFEEWVKKGRTVHAMTNKNEDLLGIIWYGAQDLPSGEEFTEELDKESYGITFAIRIYEGARGKGLSQQFMRTSLKNYLESEDYQRIEKKGIWLETSENNVAAVNSYNRFGYRQVSRPNDLGRILMVLPT